MSGILLRWASVGLAVALALAAFAKLFGAHDPAFLLSRDLSLLVAVIELVAAGLLLFGSRTTGALLTVGIMAGGVILAWTREAPCGCLGSLLELSRTSELLIAGTLGSVASLVLWGTLGGQLAATSILELAEDVGERGPL